ncbi:MAG: DUF6298 domain-containing protein [Bacteroidaceae bacterium]|nr:DUF6298 domain-containing protein [Bacteroidaceae bacterium]
MVKKKVLSVIGWLMLAVVVCPAKPVKQVFIPMDYSYCGYHASEMAIPFVENVLYVTDAQMIQPAVDELAKRKCNKKGFRGAVLLGEGVFAIDEPIRIKASGIVLRGMGRDKTILLKKGVDRGAVVYIEGTTSPQEAKEIDKSPLLEGDSKGSRISISWVGDKEWIKNHKCDDFGGGLDYTGWKEGDINMCWHRNVVEINGNEITLDAPITMFGNGKKIDKTLPQIKIERYDYSNEIMECGVENMTIKSDVTSNNLKDEDHSWDGVYMDNARDCWVRMVNFCHMAGSAVNLQRGCSRITVEDCIAYEPISEIGGWRRDVFLTRGEQTLFQRCISREGIHDFVADYCAAGPNAFVQCEAEHSHGFSGSIGAWAPGLLFDIVNIDGNDLTFSNLEQFRTGTGWNTANSMFWQCTAANIRCYSPDEDNKNSANGCWGCLWGDGEWTKSNEHVNPRSLFYSQLEQRMEAKGKKQEIDPYLIPVFSHDGTTSPSLEQAYRMAQESLHKPRFTIEMMIDSIYGKNVLSGMKTSLKPYNKKIQKVTDEITKVDVEDGICYSIPWWNGRTKDNWVKKSGRPAITRFVPGRHGTGWTDDIDEVVAFLKKFHFKAWENHYGLWYDLRRIDHERIRRADGNVEAPFYEQAFARSGEGTAWDGLSLYDLTKPNKWYWMRLRKFAHKAAKENILLYNNMYFQHNILEAGAHWVDCPWRTVNNINGTDFPEPVPFAGDKRIFMANQFYDINDFVLRPLHRQYIRMCLEQLADEPNVVHFLSAEYTGPLHFTRFWLETIAEWEAETGKHPHVAISCTKDATDAILADPRLSKIVDVIDIRYWHYTQDGLWAPTEGKNLAPRQWMRITKKGKTDKSCVEKAIKEYKDRYPDKVVIYNAQGQK